MCIRDSTEILAGEDGTVGALKCVEMELGEADASGRRRPVTKEGSDFVIEADTVIMAVSYTHLPSVL